LLLDSYSRLLSQFAFWKKRHTASKNPKRLFSDRGTVQKRGAVQKKGNHKMVDKKQVIGGPLEIGGRVLSLSRAMRAGDFVFLTGQIPMQNGVPMTGGTVQEQTRAVLDDITATLAEAGCTRDDVVKAMVWLRDRADFPGFNEVYGDYFPVEPPTRSAVVSDLLVDARVEVEVVAYRPLDGGGQ
jgi:reactive intermediate/imine deaminase